MRTLLAIGVCTMAVLGLSVPAHADLISVSGGTSSAGTAAGIIGAPSDARDIAVTNTGQQGFNEAQNVTTSVAFTMDGGTLAAGSFVDSHMIFLNKPSGVSGTLTHASVTWTFAGTILGVMSDSSGAYEDASTGELGVGGTSYPSSGFTARGLEGGDSYSFSGNTLTLTMTVTQPGDWIRVITTGHPVPEPTSVALLALGLAGVAFVRRRKRALL